MQKYLICLVVLFYCQAAIFTQSLPEKVKTLNLNSIEGNAITYYSTGHEKNAGEVKTLLEKAKAFFQSKFRIKEDFLIAVLDSSDWIKLTNIPYGLPFVSGSPYTIIIPVSSENELGRVIKKSIINHHLNKEFSLTNDEIVFKFITLIGLHELGHIYAKRYGLHFPNKWTFEFAATYIAYYFLEKQQITDCKIWYRVAKALSKELSHPKSTLREFENYYYRVGIENYAWYQSVFEMRVAEVYDDMGKYFIEILKKIHWNRSKKEYQLDVLEKVNKGFFTWAGKYELIFNDSK